MAVTTTFDTPMISLSFDDGWKNAYTRAAPILERHGLRGTFYVITRMSEFMLSEGEGRMTAADWRDLASRGHEIGSHSRTHPELSTCSDDQVAAEIHGSKADLVELGLNVETFAYPYGDLPSAGDRWIQEAGFSAGRLYDDRLNTVASSKWQLSAQGVIATHTLSDVCAWVQDAVDRRCWSILGFHQVEDPAPPYGCTPQLLDQLCAWLVARNIPVVTVHAGSLALP